jgi:Regulator of chromosome condensation (RCC1) repeat
MDYSSSSPMRREGPTKSLADVELSRTFTDDGEPAIALIQSFDYSQFYEGGNGMLPNNNNNNNKNAMAHEKTTTTTTPEEDKKLPEQSQTFLHGIPTFCKAFSNIKIGAISAHPLGAHALFISKAGLLYSYGANQRGQLGIGVAGKAIERPTIVTPLLENGGKAICCAAGVFHSLVVVENRHGQDQLYGFGRHDVLGLVRPLRSDVLLPHRVQLRGSTKIAASRDHSAAIHQDGSLYVWSVHDKPMPVDIQGERAVDVSLGPSTTLVVTESGRCLSAGSSNCGMLGQAGKTDAERFVPIDIPNQKPIVGVSAGVTHVVAWTQTGEVYGWGDAVETPQRISIETPIVQATAGRDCLFFCAKNGSVWSSGLASGRLGQGFVTEQVVSPKPIYGGLRLWYCPD